MSDRERARAVLRRIHESNVRLSFGPGMHVMTPDKFVFDAVLEALEEVRAQARAEVLRQAAEVVENSAPATQDMTSTFICEALDEVLARQEAERRAAEQERAQLQQALRGCRTHIAGYNLRDGSEVRRLLDEFFNELQRIDGVARAALAGGKA